jgi:hypothetical protein
MEGSLFCHFGRPKLAIRIHNRMISSTSAAQFFNSRILNSTLSQYADVM